jgi:serine/threonine protein kinase
MNPDQWARVKEVFNAALDKEEGARRAFVGEVTADDDAVRAEVERLLDAQIASAGFIEQPAGSMLLSGRVISHYEVGRLLGSGGMGHVYVARDTELGREVALKVASFDGDNAQARLRREAQHASRLSHPHICHIYDVGRADGQLFVVMELVKGRSLSDLLREGPLPISDARHYGMEIADALAHAHEHGVTHRDLKSTNVMITPKRGAKVLDFGLARTLDTHQIDALSHSQRSLTNEGMIAGTLPYMAPELLRGERGDQRSDIWALGVLLYEMVGGRRPFTGATGFEVSAAILHQEPHVLPSTVPAAMRAIIQRCLEKDPTNRYQNAADVHLHADHDSTYAACSEACIETHAAFCSRPRDCRRRRLRHSDRPSIDGRQQYVRVFAAGGRRVGAGSRTISRRGERITG